MYLMQQQQQQQKQEYEYEQHHQELFRNKENSDRQLEAQQAEFDYQKHLAYEEKARLWAQAQGQGKSMRQYVSKIFCLLSFYHMSFLFIHSSLLTRAMIHITLGPLYWQELVEITTKWVHHSISKIMGCLLISRLALA
jgi:hypothetical protein